MRLIRGLEVDRGVLGGILVGIKVSSDFGTPSLLWSRN